MTRTNLCHGEESFRELLNASTNFWSVIDVREKRLVHLKLHLSNFQLLFEVSEERNSSLMTATGGNGM